MLKLQRSQGDDPGLVNTAGNPTQSLILSWDGCHLLEPTCVEFEEALWTHDSE